MAAAPVPMTVATRNVLIALGLGGLALLLWAGRDVVFPFRDRSWRLHPFGQRRRHPVTIEGQVPRLDGTDYPAGLLRPLRSPR